MLVAFKNRIYVGVCHAFGRTDYSFAQFITGNFAPRINFHYAGKDQPLQLGPQAANVGREFQRKHRHGAVRKINRSAAMAGLLING